MNRWRESWWLWALISLVAGVLDALGWYQTYGYLLFGLAAGLGFTGRNRAWTFAGVLSIGSAIVTLATRPFTGHPIGTPWLTAAGAHLAGGVLVAATGITLGWLSRLCWILARRIKAPASSKA